jgi:hypothetical protein
MLVRLGILDVLPINRRQAIDSSGREVELRLMASRGFSQVARQSGTGSAMSMLNIFAIRGDLCRQRKPSPLVMLNV